MFWNDIKEIKDCVNTIICRIVVLEEKINDLKELHDDSEVYDLISEKLEDMDIERINDKINTLLEDDRRLTSVKLAKDTLDKFEDYMKNVDKLNAMINEFKGCVAMARASLNEKPKKKGKAAKKPTCP